MKSLETISLFVLGGVGGFIGALTILLLGMGEKIHEPFIAHWFVRQSPFFGLLIIISFVCIGFLIAYVHSELIVKEKEIERLESINKTTNEFVTLITHQMRAPLSFISFSIGMFLRGDFGILSEKQKGVLQEAYGSVKSATILTQDLLDVTKLTLGKLGFSLQYLNVLEIEKKINETIQRFLPMAQGRNILLSSSFALHSEKSIHLDWVRINQVIENLIENALNYTASGGEVRVEVQNNISFLSLCLSDSGIGIPEEEQSKIFNKYFRASNAMEILSGGTGIGLYLCREIIRAHRGNIWFVSNKDKGTTFCFSLPLVYPAKSSWNEVEEVLIKI